MIRLVFVLCLLSLAACEPPKPRPRVAMPLPTVAPTPTPPASPEVEPAVPTRASLAARVPVEVAALEERYRLVITSLEETGEAMSLLRAQLDSDLPSAEKEALARQAAELRDRARRLESESKELRRQAAQVKLTAQKLKGLSGAP